MRPKHKEHAHTHTLLDNIDPLKEVKIKLASCANQLLVHLMKSCFVNHCSNVIHSECKTAYNKQKATKTYVELKLVSMGTIMLIEG